MTRMTSMLLRLMLALTLSGGATSAALAGPIYRVAVDTAALAGQGGYVDFLFLGLGSAAPARASVTGSGDFGAASVFEGDATGSLPGHVTLGNGSSWNEFAQAARFGGLFEFFVSFDVGPLGDGTNLGIALLDQDFQYLGTKADIVTFALQPGQADAVSVDGAFATVQAVPEPATAVQVLTGLLLMGLVLRHRRR